MANKGWLDVASSPDGRERRLRLTGAGRRKLEAAFPAWSEAQELVRRGSSNGARG
jgi:DNA-binding MarR family transcriptional regulator